MNRLGLYHGLWAVLPHCGRPFDYVGIDVGDGECWLWASDGYTWGISREPAEPGLELAVCLPKSEALDLARGLRPKNKAQEAESVRFAVGPGELHVQVESVLNIKDGEETAVYETSEPGSMTLDYLLSNLRSMWERDVAVGPQVFNPDLYSRFADAKRESTDALTFWPRVSALGIGAGVVTVGDSFVGACMGLRHPIVPELVRSFLYDRQEDVA